MPNAHSYSITPWAASRLAAMVIMPPDGRLDMLNEYARDQGMSALVGLFSEFIGLANSVGANNAVAVEQILVAEGVLSSDTSQRANLPTIFGALNGIQLANGVDQSKVCETCAFRIGSCPNQSFDSTFDAQSCLERGSEGDFLCHERPDAAGEFTRQCAGYAQVKRR